MSNRFAPARSSTPPNTYSTTAVQRSAVSDVSRSSALSAPELAKLSPDEVEFLDAVISRAPPSATTFIHIFKAYNDVISERGLDAENEVDYYKKLLKIGTLKGENWASKWRTVRAQNGYSEASVPKLPLRKHIPTPTPPARTQVQTHLPLSRATPDTPRPQSTTARLLQRLKTMQREEPVEPSESAPDDLLSQTDMTDAGTDSLPHAEPLPRADALHLSSHPTTTPRKATGWRWSERDLDIEKSVPFLTSTPPLPTHKLPSRPTPASIGQQISNLLPINSTPRRPHADLRTAKQTTAVEDEPWNKIRVSQDERTADRFRNAQLLQQCLDVWKQGHDWVATTMIEVAHARNTFVLRVAMHKWRAVLQHQRELAALADARANAYCQKTTFVHWHVHLQARQRAAWRADMRTRMQTVRSLRDAALRRDAWAHWRRLYQSRLLQQRVEVRLVERCLVRWRNRLRETEALKGRADEYVVMKEGQVVDRCWDSWRRTTELKIAERTIAERVGARIVRESVVLWRQRTHEQQCADALHDLAIKRLAFNRWQNACGRILALERRADKQIARQEGALSASNILECFGKLGKLGRGVYGTREISKPPRSPLLSVPKGAQAFAVQYANAQLQFRILFRWRVQLRAHLKHFRQAKYADKLFVMRRAWRMWVVRAESHGREKRLKEWNNARARKIFTGWKEKASRQRRLRLAEQQIQNRADTRVLKDALSYWTNRVIAVKLRELEVVQRRDKAIVLSSFCKWKKVCIRHVEELSLMESYQTSSVKKTCVACSTRKRERDAEDQLEAAWDRWRGRFQAEKLLPLDILPAKPHASMYRAFVIWRSKTGSLPAVRFHASCVRTKFWKAWRGAMPRALEAKLARETDKKAVLTHALEKWLQMYRTKVALRAVAAPNAPPDIIQAPLTHRPNPIPARSRNLLTSTPLRPHLQTRRTRGRPTHARASATATSYTPISPSSPPPPPAGSTAPRDTTTPSRPKQLIFPPSAPRSNTDAAPCPRDPSPTRSAASQPPPSTAARASLWAELKDIRRRSRPGAVLRSLKLKGRRIVGGSSGGVWRIT
ncbi:hypothetical protein EI94DRAFT_1799925 [Lactarius quietus]|nr:hypothetical protein EI94DRAFT_1799925 [Lactarius quietus]